MVISCSTCLSNLPGGLMRWCRLDGKPNEDFCFPFRTAIYLLPPSIGLKKTKKKVRTLTINSKICNSGWYRLVFNIHLLKNLSSECITHIISRRQIFWGTFLQKFYRSRLLSEKAAGKWQLCLLLRRKKIQYE